MNKRRYSPGYAYRIVVHPLLARISLGLIFCMLFTAHVYAAPSIPAPDWLKRTAIAEKMVVNGIPSKVEYFEAERDVEEVLKYYRRRWSGMLAGHSGYREAHVKPWHIISRLEQRHLLTVQVRDSSALSADGYLAVADLDEVGTEKTDLDDIPKMAGSKVIDSNTSFDPGKKGEVVMLANKFSVVVNGNFYRDHYSTRGWGTLQDQKLAGAQAMAFRRFGTEVRLVIKESDMGSVVVINRVTSD